jgi:hypothetical protein
MSERLYLEADGEEILELFPIERTKLNGVEYLLAADSEDGDAECYLLKDMSAPDDEEAIYEVVEDEAELDSLFAIFEQLMDEITIER